MPSSGSLLSSGLYVTSSSASPVVPPHLLLSITSFLAQGWCDALQLLGKYGCTPIGPFDLRDEFHRWQQGIFNIYQTFPRSSEDVFRDSEHNLFAAELIKCSFHTARIVIILGRLLRSAIAENGTQANRIGCKHGIPSKIRGWKSMPWRVATMKESGHNSSRSASLPLLEPEALCLKTLTCLALPMNGHASWSSSC